MAESSPGTPDAASRRRTWIFRALLVLSPLLLLGALEGILRVAGVGHDTAYLQRVEIGGRGYLRNNPDFYTLFFPEHLLPEQLPFTIPDRKPRGQVRVALLGGSAAMGIPEPAFGMGPILEEQLEHRHPGVDVEVLNLGNTAINSHVVRRVAESLGRLDVDAIVIYLGNNEVVGPFGAGTLFTPGAPGSTVITSQLFLRSTRLGQLFARARESGDLPTRWRGMEMFLQQSVAYDDPALERVRDHFRENLRAIAKAGRSHGVPVIFTTVGVNLRHSAPFGSTEPSERAPEFASLVGAADLLWERASADSARALYERALTLQPTHADVHYKLGRLVLAEQDTSAAVEHLRAAREYDTLRFRADAQINAIIREVGLQESGVRLAEAEPALRAVSPYELPGREVFLEHVHLDFAGNRVVAQVIASQVEAALATVLGARDNDSWLGANDVARALAYTGYARYEVLSQTGRLISRPPFTGQSDHLEQIGRLSAELDAMQGALEPAALEAAWPMIEASIEDEPDEWIRRFRAAAFLGHGVGDWKRAEIFLRQITREQPHFPAAFNELGIAIAAQGRAGEAVPVFERSLELNPHQPDAMFQLAVALRMASPNDLDARDRALSIEERALRLEGSEASRQRLRELYEQEIQWSRENGHPPRAQELETAAREISTSR